MFLPTHTVDIFGDEKRPHNHPSVNDTVPSLINTSDYPLLGTTLLACEACFIKIGVPWIPPFGKKTQELCKMVDKPLFEFVKTNLVSVKSSTIEAYCSDLEGIPEENNCKDLFINIGSPVHRSALSALTGITVMLIFLAYMSSIAANPTMSAIFSIFAGGIAGCFIAIFSCDTYRVETFHWLLLQELERRQGMGQGTGRGLKTEEETFSINTLCEKS